MSVYNTGTITLVSGITTVSGYGTTWLEEISIGNLIMKRGASVAWTIAGILSDTQLSLNTTYPGPTESGLVYDIIRDFTANANLPKPYGADRSDWPTIWADDLDKMDNWALGWNQTPFTCTYVSSTSFTCSGDKTSIFQDGSRLKIVHGGGTTYHSVQSSSYSSVTTVVVDGTITTPISQVYHALFITGASGSFPTTHHLTYLDAVDANGLSIRDDGHNLGIFVKDSGNVGIKTTSPNNEFTVSGDIDITGLTASKPIFTDASKKLVSTGTTPVDQGGTGAITASGAFDVLKQNATGIYAGVVNLDNILPWMIDVDAPAAPLTGTGWASTVDASMVNNAYLGSDGVQNREVTWPVILGAGTWTIYLMHTTDVNRGIYTFYSDATLLGTIDGYSAATTYNVIGFITDIVVASTGKVILKIKIATKHASSSSYVGTIQHIRLLRTA